MILSQNQIVLKVQTAGCGSCLFRKTKMILGIIVYHTNWPPLEVNIDKFLLPWHIFASGIEIMQIAISIKIVQMILDHPIFIWESLINSGKMVFNILSENINKLNIEDKETLNIQTVKSNQLTKAQDKKVKKNCMKSLIINAQSINI